jgi:hypothetical protein
MNKPITSRVREATNGNRGVQEPLLDVGAAGVRGGAATRKQPSPLKKTTGDIKGEKSYGPGLGNMFDGVTSLEKTSMPTFEPYSATSTIANVADDTKATPKTKVLMNPGVNLGGGNASLVSGSANVAGGITRGTDIKTEGPPKSDIKRSGRTIGDAFQDNMVARIDKAGELGRARRDARRAKKAGISESKASSAPSAEKIARDKRVDDVISRNTPSTSTTVSSAKPGDDLLNRLDTEGALGAPVQMRMNANIGIKSKSPMKKGYFKGM